MAKKCPNCGNKNIIKFIYGMPTCPLDKDLQERHQKELDEGRVVMAGCIVECGATRWKCKVCFYGWGRPSSRF